MASTHFATLSENILELKRIYLAAGAAVHAPTIEEQEMARAFAVFTHAEIEWYVERICIDFANKVLAEATNDKFSSSTLALLTFAAIEPLNGGQSLSKKSGARSLTTRVGDASAKQRALAEENEGIREKHLSKLFVPLGMNASHIHSAWLADVDSLSSMRGAQAHMSRSEKRASHLAVNPSDLWQLCDRVVWHQPTGSTLVSSFEDLDDWLVQAMGSFATVSVAKSPSLWKSITNRLRR